MIYEKVIKVYKNFKEGDRIDIPKDCLLLNRTITLDSKDFYVAIELLVPVKLNVTQENVLEEIPNLIKDEYED